MVRRQDRDVDYLLNIGRVIANAGSSIKSLIDETAMVNGRLPSKQAAFNDFMSGYLDRIWTSIGDTEGGGYMYGGMQPGVWNDGAYGVVTVRKNDPRTPFVHVITPPSSGDEVRLRDAGYKVLGVSDVRTGKALSFHQSGGYLSITGVGDWDPYDTVFRVRTTGERQFFYPQQSIRATATPSRPGFPDSNLTDGSYLDYWDAGQPKPPAGTMPSVRGIQFVDLPPQHARYVRLEIDDAWASPDVPSYYNKVAIDEMYVVHGYPSSA